MCTDRGMGRVLVLAAGVAVNVMVATAGAQTPVYRVRVLPDLGHGDVAAWAINASGVVAGSAYDGNVTRPVRWEGNTPIPLTKGPQEAVYFWSNAINDENHVVGTMRVNDQDFAFRHTPEGGLVQIITPIGDQTSSAAHGINDAGVVAGQRDLHAVVLFTDGTITEIRLAGAPEGLDYGHAAAVNNSNVVVGTTMGPPDGSRAGASPRAFSWTAKGGIVNLVDFGFDASTTFANDINDKGDIVGAASLGDPLNLVPQEACLWRHDEIVALADLNDGVSSNAVAINSAGHVLGYDGDDGGIGLPVQQHWIWINEERHFLADLIQNMPADTRVVFVRDLSDTGQIVVSLVQEQDGKPPMWMEAVLEPVTECRADYNSDGSVTSQDFFDFLVDFFNGSADFNGDGSTNSQDFFDFLAEFFEGCV